MNLTQTLGGPMTFRGTLSMESTCRKHLNLVSPFVPRGLPGLATYQHEGTRALFACFSRTSFLRDATNLLSPDENSIGMRDER